MLAKKQRDFGVYMARHVLDHKLTDGMEANGRFCFWKFGSGGPYGIEEGSRMWVAAGKRWQGYFLVRLSAPGELVEFHSESWVRFDGGPRTQFRGFTYKVPLASRDGHRCQPTPLQSS